MSLSRIPLGAVLWIAPGRPWFLFAVGLVAALTDIFDGTVARHVPRGRAVVSADAGGIGSWLDPLCDKLFVVQAFVVVVVTYQPPAWAMAVLLLRDVVQTLLLLGYRAARGRAAIDAIDYHANPWGKATTVVQFLTLTAVVFDLAAAVPLAVLAGGLGLMAVAVMARRVLRQA